VFFTGSPSLLFGRVGSASATITLYAHLISGHIGTTHFRYSRTGPSFGGRFGSSRVSATILYDGEIVGHVDGARSTCVATPGWYFCRGAQVETLIPLAALVLARG